MKIPPTQNPIETLSHRAHKAAIEKEWLTTRCVYLNPPTEDGHLDDGAAPRSPKAEAVCVADLHYGDVRGWVVQEWAEFMLTSDGEFVPARELMLNQVLFDRGERSDDPDAQALIAELQGLKARLQRLS